MDRVPGRVLLYDGNGNKVEQDKPAEPLSPEEARVMRDFKKILQRRGLQHNFRCAKCGQNRVGREGYLDWTIGPDKIILMCGCRQIVFLGQTL